MSIIKQDEAMASAPRLEPKDLPFNINTDESLLAGQSIHHTLLPEYAKRCSWEWVVDNYCKDDKVKLRNVTMLVLRESVGLPLIYIARLFGIHKGNVVRGMHRAHKDLYKLVIEGTDEKDLQ